MYWPARLTAVAGEVDGLFAFVLIVVGLWLLAAEAFLVFCVWRSWRSRSSPWRPRREVPALWIAAFGAAVLLCDLAIEARSLPVWRALKEESPLPDLEVRAVAKQFRWRFRYPGPDARFGTDDDHEVDSELHVPVGAQLRLVLQSEDVIHSFFLPAARLKQDVVPGRQAAVWLRPEQVGRFEIACAELCGFAHYTMRAFLVVHSPDDYRQWEKEEWGASEQQETNGSPPEAK